MRRARRNAVLGVLCVVSYAAFAAVQALILNPLAGAPGRSLSQIVADVHANHDSLGTWMTLAVLGAGIALALMMLVVTWLSSAPRPCVVTAWYLGMIALGSPAYIMASFGPMVSIADTYGIRGADASPWGIVLHLVSALALVTLIIVLIRDVRPQAAALPAV